MTGISTLGQALDQIERLKTTQTQFDLLNYQLASSKKTNKFSGLGADLLVSKRSRASFSSLEVYQNNIKIADNRVQHQLTALKEFRAQTKSLRDFLVNFAEEGTHQEGSDIRQDDPLTPENEAIRIGQDSAEMETDFKTMANFAKNIEGFLMELVNRQEDGRYLFSGADTANKPLDSLALLDSQMSAAIMNWKNEGSATNITTEDFIADLKGRVATISNPDVFSDTVVGFNSSLVSGTSGKIYARINATSEVDYTSLANNQGIRDVLVAVSFLKNENLPPAVDVYTQPYTYGDTPVTEGAPGATVDEQMENFFAMINAVENMVNTSLSRLDEQIADLEMARVQLDQASKVNTEQKNVVQGLIDDVENVDLNEVAVKLTSLQTTLQASYQVTAMMQQMSLVNFM